MILGKQAASSWPMTNYSCWGGGDDEQQQSIPTNSNCHFTHKVAVKRKHNVAAAFGKPFVSLLVFRTSQIALTHKVAVSSNTREG
jgi:hypothetical protein